MKQIFSIVISLFLFSNIAFGQIPTNTLVQIVKAEDERRSDATLENLLKNPNEKIRIRAALAVGRIGDERSIPALVNLLENDTDAKVRAMAAFAIGETEAAKGTDAILKVLKNGKEANEVRARTIEAAGKIIAANKRDAKLDELGQLILTALDDEIIKAKPDRQFILFGLTAILRARPANGEFIAAKFLDSADARIRADALNTLARLRDKNAVVKVRELLQKDADPIVRANAARVLGAAEDKDSFGLLLAPATRDKDQRVRISAIRALGSLKNAMATDVLLQRAETLMASYKKSKFATPIEKNKLLEIASALGRILPNTNNERAVKFLREFRELEKVHSPETEIAFAQISPTSYLNIKPLISINYDASSQKLNADLKAIGSVAQGLGETAKLKADAESLKLRERSIIALLAVTENLFGIKDYDSALAPTMPDVLRAFAAFKINNLSEVLRAQLQAKDIFVRATTAELLAELPASKENIEALKTAFAESLATDKDYNDAQLAILSALVKLDKKESFESLRLALKAPDYLVRRHAANLIKENDLTKDFSNIERMVGTVKPYNPQTGTKLGQVLNTQADYIRAVSRKNARAIITTEKGTFTIEFFPEDAPLAVDNFIKLAKSRYFNNVAIHRVVPNFVMQDGDPRGDGNGGPGWQIRCEINEIPYERGMVGMALSGKDTGGSQWFVTHSPQPHLDGGYTVFGRVNETDMKIVDNLARGDKILSVRIVEGVSRKGLSEQRKKN